jgi:hypothetical protein
MLHEHGMLLFLTNRYTAVHCIPLHNTTYLSVVFPAASSSLEPIAVVDSKSTCGFSKITQITCWSQTSSEVGDDHLS